MKNIHIIILIAFLCLTCEHFADYRYEVRNQIPRTLLVQIGFYSGKDTLHTDTVGALSAKQVLYVETPITLGCNEDSPHDRGFDNISKFVIAVIDSPSIQKDFKGSNHWTYKVTDRTGIYSISITDPRFSK